MKISEIMTKNLSVILPDTNLKQAAKEMASRNVGVLPVHDGKSLVGLLTDRDIVVRSTARGDSPEAVKVKDVMSKELDTCGEEEEIEKVSGRMKKDKIRRMPVLDKNGKLAGIVSMADIVLKGQKDVACEVLEKVSGPGK